MGAVLLQPQQSDGDGKGEAVPRGGMPAGKVGRCVWNVPEGW